MSPLLSKKTPKVMGEMIDAVEALARRTGKPLDQVWAQVLDVPIRGKGRAVNRKSAPKRPDRAGWNRGLP